MQVGVDEAVGARVGAVAGERGADRVAGAHDQPALRPRQQRRIPESTPERRLAEQAVDVERVPGKPRGRRPPARLIVDRRRNGPDGIEMRQVLVRLGSAQHPAKRRAFDPARYPGVAPFAVGGDHLDVVASAVRRHTTGNCHPRAGEGSGPGALRVELGERVIARPVQAQHVGVSIGRVHAERDVLGHGDQRPRTAGEPEPIHRRSSRSAVALFDRGSIHRRDRPSSLGRLPGTHRHRRRRGPAADAS